MDITGDENWPESDEHSYAEMTREQVVTNYRPAALLHMEKGVDSEVRVELDLTARVLANGDVMVDGVAKLYEGTSEDTSNLDGVRHFNVVVPKDRAASQHVKVRNDNEGGDKASINLSLFDSRP